MDHKNQSKINLTWIPLFGLWIALFYSRKYQQATWYRQGVVLHFIWVFYFVVSSSGLLLLNLIVPYFLGSFGEIIFRIHTVLVLTGFLGLMTVGMGFWGERLMERWFEGSELLEKIQNILFPY